MNLLSCPSCHCAAKSHELACPHCGARLRDSDGRIARTTVAIVLGLSGVTGCVSTPLYGIAGTGGIAEGGQAAEGGSGGAGGGGGDQGGATAGGADQGGAGGASEGGAGGGRP